MDRNQISSVRKEITELVKKVYDEDSIMIDCIKIDWAENGSVTISNDGQEKIDSLGIAWANTYAITPPTPRNMAKYHRGIKALLEKLYNEDQVRINSIGAGWVNTHTIDERGNDVHEAKSVVLQTKASRPYSTAVH